MSQYLRRSFVLLLTLTLLLGSTPPVARAQTYALEVYNNASYAGGWCYSNSPMTANIAASCNDQVSSILLFSGWSMRAYRDQNQGGPSACFNRSDGNLSDNTFEDGSSADNAISSFTLYSQAWCGGSPTPAYPLEIYNDPSYNGNWCYSPNAEAADIYVSCSDLTSAILLRSGWSIRVYRDAGQSGPSACLTASDADLSDNTFADGSPLNDAISSFALYNQSGCPAIDPTPTPTNPLEVYANSHYTGTRCYSLSPETANIHVSCNDQISSLLLQPGWSVRLYSDVNNGGTSACFNASDNDLADNTFDDGSPINDAISSFTLVSQAACPSVLPPATYPLQVFTGANYTGTRCFSVAAESANIYATCNDQVSSLLLQPGWSIRVYRDANQGGASACLSTSDSNLGDNSFNDMVGLNDAISSFTLYQQATCPTSAPPTTYALEVYNDPGYSGWWCYSNAPTTANIHVSCADHISSLRLLPGWSVRVYRDPGQGGPEACFTASDADLRNNAFSNGASLNDAISSFVLYHQSSCPPLNSSPETPTEPNPTPTPEAPLTLEYFSVDASALARNCYYVRVTLRNHTDQPLTQEVRLQERANYYSESIGETFLGGERGDRVKDCKSDRVSAFSGAFVHSSSITVPANGTQSMYFWIGHDWDWIKRESRRSIIWGDIQDAILEKVAEKWGAPFSQRLVDAYGLANIVKDISDALNAAPIARYTYKLTTSDLPSVEQAIWVDIPQIQRGYLNGSLVDAVANELCGLAGGKYIKIILIPCALSYISAMELYLQAQGPAPWQSTQRVRLAEDLSYTSLVEPQPIVVDVVSTLSDPSQRAFAEGYLDAISYQRAAVTSYEYAEQAALAGNMHWYNVQIGRARQFHDREQAITRSMIDVGDSFLSGLAPLSISQIDQFKNELATSGFDAETKAIYAELGLSDEEQQALGQRLSLIPTEDWPLPPDVSIVALRHSQAIDDIANTLGASTHITYMPLMQR
jgi:hypothetical protein